MIHADREEREMGKEKKARGREEGREREKEGKKGREERAATLTFGARQE